MAAPPLLARGSWSPILDSTSVDALGTVLDAPETIPLVQNPQAVVLRANWQGERVPTLDRTSTRDNSELYNRYKTSSRQGGG